MASYPILGGVDPEDVDLGRVVRKGGAITNRVRYAGERHLIAFGANGSGKGTRILQPNLLAMRGERSIVALDPKGELAAVSAPFRSRVSRVVIINPFGVLLDRQGFEHMESVGFNPLARLDPFARDFGAKASELAEAMISVESTQPHWDESARALLAALIMYVVLEAHKLRRVPTIKRVRELLCLASEAPSKFDPDKKDGQGIPKLARDMMRSNIAALRNKASQFTEWNGEIQSIASTAKRQTECFDDADIADDLCKNGFDFRDIKRRPTTVYLVLPPDKTERHGKWLRLAVTAALQACMRPREQGEPRVLFLLDEFAALGRIKIVENVWSVVRGYGIQMMPVFQDLNQLKSLYQDRWETFIANAGAVAAFAPNDLTTAKWLSERMGDTTRMLVTESDAESKSGGRNWGMSGGTNINPQGQGSNQGFNSGGNASWSKNHSVNTSPVKVPLMTPHQLIGLDPGYMVLFMAGLSHPVPIYAPNYWEIEERKARAYINPYYEPVPPRRGWQQDQGQGFDPYGGMQFDEPFFGEEKNDPFSLPGMGRGYARRG